MNIVYGTIAEFLLFLNNGLVESPDKIADEATAFLIVLCCLALVAVVSIIIMYVRGANSLYLSVARWLAAAALVVAVVAISLDFISIREFGRPLSNIPATWRIVVALVIGIAGGSLWFLGKAIWNRLSYAGGLPQRLGKSLLVLAIAGLWCALLLLFGIVQTGILLGIQGAFSPQYTAVEIFFGTDRKKAFMYRVEGNGQPGWVLTNSRGKELTLGKAVVTVPVSHRRGTIELPAKYVLFGATVYKEKEDPKKHFTLSAFRLFTQESLIREVNEHIIKGEKFKRSALIFIHGYNTGFEVGLFRTAQLSYDLGFDGATFLYSWPAKGGFEQYESDRNTSEQSQRYLKEFIDIVINGTNADRVHIIAHSMGNGPLLRVLKELTFTNTAVAKPKLQQIILAAPDIDRDIFEQLVGAVAHKASLTLYASANDRAMVASKVFGGGIPRAGDVPPDGPVIVGSMDTIDASDVNTDIFSWNHSSYAQSPQLLSDIGVLILCGLRPPSDRSPAFEKVIIRTGAYWRLTGAGSASATASLDQRC